MDKPFCLAPLKDSVIHILPVLVSQNVVLRQYYMFLNTNVLPSNSIIKEAVSVPMNNSSKHM